jgi:hypothetical protein
MGEATEFTVKRTRAAGELEPHPAQDTPEGAGADFELRMNDALPSSASDEFRDGGEGILAVLGQREVEQGLRIDPGTLQGRSNPVLERLGASLPVASTPTVEGPGRRAAHPPLGGEHRLSGNDLNRTGLPVPLGEVVFDE